MTYVEGYVADGWANSSSLVLKLEPRTLGTNSYNMSPQCQGIRVEASVSNSPTAKPDLLLLSQRGRSMQQVTHWRAIDLH